MVSQSGHDSGSRWLACLTSYDILSHTFMPDLPGASPREELTTHPVSQGGTGAPRKATSFGVKCSVRPCGPNRTVRSENRIDPPTIFRSTRREGRKQHRSRGCLPRRPCPGWMAKPLIADLAQRTRIPSAIKTRLSVLALEIKGGG